MGRIVSGLEIYLICPNCKEKLHYLEKITVKEIAVSRIDFIIDSSGWINFKETEKYADERRYYICPNCKERIPSKYINENLTLDWKGDKNARRKGS